MDYLISFLIGGVICALVQILLDRTKLMPGRVMVCLVCGGVILGFAFRISRKQEQVCRCLDLEMFCGKG